MVSLYYSKTTDAMPFTVTHRIENKLEEVVLTDGQSGSSASVLPTCGAVLHAFTLQTPNGAFNIIDHYGSLDELNIKLTDSHKSSKLSPFVCRIKEGKYSFDDKKFEFLNKFSDGSAIHGLLVTKSFEIINESANATSASVTMKYEYRRDDPGYPFDYQCTVKYHLKHKSVLVVETTVTNMGNQSIPLADGWHPYFTLNGDINDWELYLHAGQMLEFDQKLIPTGHLVANTKFITPEKIGDTFIDNCFLLDALNKTAACCLKNPRNGWELLFFPEENYPYLQIYTPPHRKSIAIENLSGAPDCFNNGMGLIILEPGKSQTFILRYQVLITK